MLKAFQSVDHVSAATGKTIAITISKNGGAFGNPNAGATNATEVSSGWYKVTLDATDTATVGPLVVRGTAAATDDVELLCFVVAIPATVPTAIENADALLKRDMSAVSGEASRSPLNALRFLRNKWSLNVSRTLITICKEDDTTTAWTGAVTSASGSPISGIDP
jgi:hypothetical protein